MNILFLALAKLQTIHSPGIYTDLLRQFAGEGHAIYLVTADEEAPQNGPAYTLTEEKGAKILTVRTGRIQQTGILEKGINTVLLEKRFISAINKAFEGVRFDLILYPTPPITFVGVVEHLKERDGARTYLLLKDIFPQNAVDLGMMSTGGAKGLLYRYFRSQEQRLYAVSDSIGCMSKANVLYLIQHNPEINPEKVGVFPNSIEVVDRRVDDSAAAAIREKYGIPADKKVFVYGGNLGRPQGIPFLIQCLEACLDLDCLFLIIGDGTDYPLLESYARTSGQNNLKLMKRIPKEDYDKMVGACDVGMIVLDHRFTIPNFPSRLLSYLQAGLPVMACTDPNTDIGQVVTEGGFGWWCESNREEGFRAVVKEILAMPREELIRKGDLGFAYLDKEYNVKNLYRSMIG